MDAVGNGASKCISSPSLLIQSEIGRSLFFIPPSRFDSMRVLSVLSARRDWSVRALDDVRERCFDHTFCLSELGEVPVDNRSNGHP